MEAATATANQQAPQQKGDDGKRRLPTKWIVALGVAALLLAFIGLFAAFGSEGQNQEYQPQNEFKLDPWISLELGALDMSINKAVLYLIIAAILTTTTMIYIARRMEQKPNLTQTAVEAAYDLTNRII